MIFAILGLLGLAFLIGGDDDDTVDATAEASAPDSTSQGSASDDFIEGSEGDDRIFARTGDDVVSAAAGNDSVFGAEGDDVIAGGNGDDFLRGGDGADLVYGEAGEDTLYGDAGDDLLDGTDVLDATGLIEASAAAAAQGTFLSDAEIAAFIDEDRDSGEADTLIGGVGNDLLIAGNNDVVISGAGVDDILIGDWMDPGAPVEITDFDPRQDAIIFSYRGDTEPTVFFGEDDSGLTTLEVAISDTENAVFATLPGVDVFDLSAGNLFLTQPA